MKADEEDKLFHTDGAWWTFLKSGKWNGENDYTLFVEFVDLMFTALTQEQFSSNVGELKQMELQFN